jgi:histidine triad (HIT) family protein
VVTVDGCVFCEIVDGKAPANYVEIGERHVAITPHRPHVPGHVLFIPRAHVPDATTAPGVTGYTVAAASAYVRGLRSPANIITSVGAEATQTVFHLHVHVLPRGANDGLRKSWPWRVKPGEELGPGEAAPADWEPSRGH